MTASHIIYGLIAIFLGLISIKYSYQIVQFTGVLDSINQRMTVGSSNLFIKLLGITLILGGMLYATGLGGSVMRVILDPLVNLFPSS